MRATIVMLGLVFSSAAAWATVIDFNGTGTDRLLPAGVGQEDGNLDNTFGSRAVGDTTGITGGNTPHIAVTWGIYESAIDGKNKDHWLTANNISFWTPNYTNDATTDTTEITLTADPGYKVQMTGFDLRLWADGRVVIKRMIQGETEFTSIYDNTLSNGGTYPFDESGLAPTEKVSYKFWLEGRSNFLDLDNLSFTEVPEPTTIGLLMLGISALTARRRVSA